MWRRLSGRCTAWPVSYPLGWVRFFIPVLQDRAAAKVPGCLGLILPPHRLVRCDIFFLHQKRLEFGKVERFCSRTEARGGSVLQRWASWPQNFKCPGMPVTDPGRPGPPCPQDFFFYSCSFQASLRENPYFEQILGSGPPPWGQNSAGPPDQNTGYAPACSVLVSSLLQNSLQSAFPSNGNPEQWPSLSSSSRFRIRTLKTWSSTGISSRRAQTSCPICTPLTTMTSFGGNRGNSAQSATYPTTGNSSKQTSSSLSPLVSTILGSEILIMTTRWLSWGRQIDHFLSIGERARKPENKTKARMWWPPSRWNNHFSAGQCNSWGGRVLMHSYHKIPEIMTMTSRWLPCGGWSDSLLCWWAQLKGKEIFGPRPNQEKLATRRLSV